MKKTFYLILVFIIAGFKTTAGEIPQISRNKNGLAQMIVDGKPYIMLAGELMNSSASTLESMAPRWERLKQLNLNTLLLTVSWQQLEPEEDQFDFSIVDGLIKQAREYDLKLVFLWFGSWKNASSGYAPHWVMRDTKRFPRMQNDKGENIPFLSNFSDELVKADSKAYSALMNHIKEVDNDEHTVIMCQIENEVGIRGDSRDRSPKAEALFKGEVPAELIKHIQKNEKQILPEIIKQWNDHGRMTKGSWLEVFGNESRNLADEMFMAWYYAKFIEKVAAEGKKAYSLPMFVNAWTISPEDPNPGIYPSGGPNERMLDVWQVAAPSIDVLAVDNYRDDFISRCKDFCRSGNPLFVPEAVALWKGDKWSAPAKAFYTIGELDALCFSPFGIDNQIYDEKHPIRNAYEVLENLMPLILKERGTDNMRGFMQQENKTDRIDFDDYYISIRYNYTYQGYGLVIRLSKDEFLVAGNGVDLSISSKIKTLPGISYGLIREGRFVDGAWKTLKYLGGDEAMQGVGGVKLPPVYLKEDANQNEVSIIRIKVIPVESAASTTKEAFD